MKISSGSGSLLHSIKKGAVSLLYPPVCPLCDRTLPIGESGRLCKKCEGRIKPIAEPKCLKCGRQLNSAEQEYCTLCRKRKFHYNSGFSVYNYEGEVKDSILKLKYNGRKDIAEYFANSAIDIYGKRLKALGIDAVIPIPLHKNRLKKRGYNQALAIAAIIAEKLGIECIEDVLIRTKQTDAQKELSANERILNLYDAFEVDREALEKHKKRRTIEKVLLVDDIYTTGSTIECCSFTLLKYGIKDIWFLCAASTDYHG